MLRFNREIDHDIMGMYVKEIESDHLLYVADSQQTRLRDERGLTHF